MLRLDSGFSPRVWCAVLGTAMSLCVVAGQAEAEEKIALGELQISAPDDFKRETPRSRIIAYEFSAPAAGDDQRNGRMTVMAAGGSIQQNLDRWYGQFSQPDGKATKDRAQVEEFKAAGQEVVLVDIRGTYDDKPAPFAEGVKRKDYRMLAAIISTDEANFYVKFYGPDATIDEHASAFRKMIKGLSNR